MRPNLSLLPVMRRTLSAILGIVGIASTVSAATLVQTFEAGEDTSNWGASWTEGDVTDTFLEQSLGGLNAGSGTSASQSFSRSFKDNTAGLDLASAYSRLACMCNWIPLTVPRAVNLRSLTATSALETRGICASQQQAVNSILWI